MGTISTVLKGKKLFGLKWLGYLAKVWGGTFIIMVIINTYSSGKVNNRKPTVVSCVKSDILVICL